MYYVCDDGGVSDTSSSRISALAVFPSPREATQQGFLPGYHGTGSAISWRAPSIASRRRIASIIENLLDSGAMMAPARLKDRVGALLARHARSPAGWRSAQEAPRSTREHAEATKFDTKSRPGAEKSSFLRAVRSRSIVGAIFRRF